MTRQDPTDTWQEEKGELAPICECIEDVSNPKKAMLETYPAPLEGNLDQEDREMITGSVTSTSISSELPFARSPVFSPTFSGEHTKPGPKNVLAPLESKGANTRLNPGSYMHREIMAALQDANVSMVAKSEMMPHKSTVSTASLRNSGRERQDDDQRRWAKFVSVGKSLSMLSTVH